MVSAPRLSLLDFQIQLITADQGIKLHEDFGFAPSTLVYQGENASSVESQAS
jgi:hypothetical protein